MPSASSMNKLRPHQDELLQLAELAGIHMDKEIFRCMVVLLNMGVTPDAIFDLLKIMRRGKLDPIRSRKSSHTSHRVSTSKHHK